MLLEFLQEATKLKDAPKMIAGAVTHRQSHGLMHAMATLGPMGVFLIAIVDASFIPLPIPGFTDILVIVLAAQRVNWALLALAATGGSIVGGYISYRVGAAGGITLLEKRVPKKYFARLCEWVEKHTFLAVAVPALMPPPTPTSIFILAAGALKVPKRKFIAAFLIARAIRYTAGSLIGLLYGRHVVHEWNAFNDKYGDMVAIVLWSLIGCAVLYASWYTWRHVRNEKKRRLEGKTVWKELAEDS